MEQTVITTNLSRAFERVSLDLMGSLDVRNYNSKSMLTLVCNLTKYVETYT